MIKDPEFPEPDLLVLYQEEKSIFQPPRPIFIRHHHSTSSPPPHHFRSLLPLRALRRTLFTLQDFL